MPRKSIYFTDELLPRALEAAELDDRSLSSWVGLAVEAKLAASPAAPNAGTLAREIAAGASIDVRGVLSPDADVLRAASKLPKTRPADDDDGPVFARYVKNAAGRQVPVSTAGEIIKAEQLEAAKRKASS